MAACVYVCVDKGVETDGAPLYMVMM